jgi:DnaJ-class molecular chaperone
MHKVDPMEIMLSDIFDKVFYSKDQEPRTTICLECEGDGEVEIEVFMPQNFDRDVGYIDHKKVECPECGGLGEVEVEDE